MEKSKHRGQLIYIYDEKVARRFVEAGERPLSVLLNKKETVWIFNRTPNNVIFEGLFIYSEHGESVFNKVYK